MITIRPAQPDDARMLWEWRNDEQTRAASVSTEEVAWTDHEAWFERALHSDQRSILVALRVPDGSLPGEPLTTPPDHLGMVRFDFEDDGAAAEVSINLAPDFRGQGLSAPILRAAIESFAWSAGARPLPLDATIRRTNLPSIRLFKRLDFAEVRVDDDFLYLRRPPLPAL